MRLAISHETLYRYDTPVRHSTQYLRLTPLDGSGQHIIDWSLDLPSGAHQCTDSYGNVLHVLTLDYPHQEIRIRAHGTVETDNLIAVDGPLPPLLFLRQTRLTQPDGRLAEFADGFRLSAPSLAQLCALMNAIRARMPFLPGETHSQTTAADAFRRGVGVCQDHTHVFLACARHLGVPARYVSGYVYSPGHADHHVASHAWAEAWIDGTWYSFDVANGTRANDHHLKLAIGMDYLDACPIRGVRFGGGEERMQAQARVIQHDQQ
jgi:transglutaminase-like putative cysteine protease